MGRGEEGREGRAGAEEGSARVVVSVVRECRQETRWAGEGMRQWQRSKARAELRRGLGLLIPLKKV
jgi:hypothetical protein